MRKRVLFVRSPQFYQYWKGVPSINSSTNVTVTLPKGNYLLFACNGGTESAYPVNIGQGEIVLREQAVLAGYGNNSNCDIRLLSLSTDTSFVVSSGRNECLIIAAFKL